ncbi:MAG TPA: ribosome silencing factor [Candidatus Cloacimonetes bacterium]|nr:ribosome silencing factor [Candidatus Cloacimonadota bacterium]
MLQDNVKLEAIISWLKEKNAEDIRVYEVQGKTDYTDLIIVCEGSADVHNKAIANHVIDMAKKSRFPVLGKEGVENGEWVLIDLTDVVVHIFLPDMREYYQIDELFEKVKSRKAEEETQ